MGNDATMGLEVVEPKEEHTGEFALVRQMGNLPAELWPDARILAIRQLYGKEAKNLAQLGVFLSIADKHGLDPALSEIWLIQTNKGPKAYAGRDGFLKSASRQPHMYGGIQSGVVYEQDEFWVEVTGEGARVHHKFAPTKRQGRPHGAYAIVYDKQSRPTYVYRETKKCEQMKSFYWTEKSVDDAIHNRAVAAALRRVVPLGGLMIEGEVPLGFDEDDVAEAVGKTSHQKLKDMRVKLGIDAAPDPEIEVVEGVPVEEELDELMEQKAERFNIPPAAIVAWAEASGAVSSDIEEWGTDEKTVLLQSIIASDGMEVIKEYAKKLVEPLPDMEERLELLTVIANTERRKVLDGMIERMLER